MRAVLSDWQAHVGSASVDRMFIGFLYCSDAGYYDKFDSL